MTTFTSNLFHLVCAGVIATFLASANAKSVSQESLRLAQCEFIYSYAAQMAQLQNNEGAARNFLRRASMLTTANMMNNEVNGTIADWKIKDFTFLREPLKRKFDAGIANSLVEASKCDTDAMPVAQRVRSSGKNLWGKSFDELQQFFFDSFRKNLGL